MSLTRRQEQVLAIVRPVPRVSLSEIAEELHLATTTVFEHVRRLQRKDVLRRARYARRALEIVPSPYPRRLDV